MSSRRKPGSRGIGDIVGIPAEVYPVLRHGAGMTAFIMSILEGALLGLIQGLTEFLPISSTGHLILVRQYLGIGDEHGLAFDAVLHIGTLLAVAMYFRRQLFALATVPFSFIGMGQRGALSQERRMLFWAVIIGMIPAGIVGLLIEDLLESAFRSAGLVAWMLIAGSFLMAAAEIFGRQNRLLSLGRSEAEAKKIMWPQAITLFRALIIGLFQCLALLPGISRSGSTIAGGMLAGLNRKQAAEFSFLVGFPLLMGGGVKKMIELSTAGFTIADGASVVVGFFTALVSGIFAIEILLRFLKNHSLTVFIIYRVVLAVAVFYTLTL